MNAVKTVLRSSVDKEMEVVSEGYAARNRLSLDNSSRKAGIRVIALRQRQTRHGGGKPPRYFFGDSACSYALAIAGY